ncbi:hypothetical protein AKJ08_3572 [Vulgatibacter incomptus]|uniref:Uncharacterized protein n=1 Tax=Vulgatibacter incomptus TaxID=1391653 RepID=A0A0K1PI33_9BACT|nr:hypothetical protein AKJ08_3572 [Vulgatibacter incomptus]
MATAAVHVRPGSSRIVQPSAWSTPRRWTPDVLPHRGESCARVRARAQRPGRPGEGLGHRNWSARHVDVLPARPRRA